MSNEPGERYPVIKKRMAEQKHAPAGWERAAAAVTWLSVNITLLAVVLGLLEFILLRKRRPFLALHGARAAIAQGIVICLVLVLYIGAINFHSIRDSFSYLLYGVVPNIMHSPGSASYYWGILSPLSRIMLSIILGILPAILLVSCIGAFSALFGHRQTPADLTSLPATVQ